MQGEHRAEYRWVILFVLFFARTTMAFQYQSAAALAPFITQSFAVSLAELGLLIGLYLGPGIVVAIPGGALAARFGDTRVVTISLAMMLGGGLIIALAPNWEALLAGRVIAGIGGVIVNIVMTKMLVDWFAGREIGTAMGVFVSSWPLGIAAALISLPALADIGGLLIGSLGTVTIVAVALILFVAFYRSAAPETPVKSARISRDIPVKPLSLAAGVWALYNTALAMVFAFGTLLLTSKGVSTTASGATVSLFTLFVGIGIPIGGFLSDKIGRDRIIMASLTVSALSVPTMAFIPLSTTTAFFAVAGLLMGLCAGPIMTLPSQVLSEQSRAFGMGVFFAVYYAVMMVGPAAAGAIADWSGFAESAFLMGSLMLAACIALHWSFIRTTQPDQT